MEISNNVGDLLDGSYQSIEGVLVTSGDSTAENQAQTNKIFSEKWVKYSEEEIEAQERLFAFQREWYLALYDFADEGALGDYLQQQEVILDAGCGLGYKAHWFSQLSPDSLVIGMDYSDAVFVAADRYAHIPNLKFIKGDIADTRLKKDAVSYVSCDQVIHHTEDPQKTMIELARILKPGGDLAVYVYAKKALPRELLDDHFRLHTKDIPADEMWQMSEQLTELAQLFLAR
jgi:ubiquinone/menaquinone biosynthesis C-methylase UbiE